jgi:hypothetical protein
LFKEKKKGKKEAKAEVNICFCGIAGVTRLRGKSKFLILRRNYNG